jgi:hypothetical protein
VTPKFDQQEQTILLLAMWQWSQTDPLLNAVNPTFDEDEAAAGLRSLVESIVSKLGGQPDDIGFGLGSPASEE